MTRADVAAVPIEVLPENERSFLLFVDLMTQWRVGVSGPIGLDYAAIPPVMEMRGIASEDRSALFDDLRTMESAALEAMRGE